MTSLPVNSIDPLAFLDSRRSVPARQLDEPGPDDATLARMLQASVRVPDHGKRVPFRFVRIAGDSRAALGDALARRARERDPDASASTLDKDRSRFLHAPLVIVVVAILDDNDDKIPKQERLMTAGCVCFALLQAAQACGFGAVWLSGWPAYDKPVRALLGLGRQERVAGFMHIGTSRIQVPERDRPEASALLVDWAP